MAEIIPRQSSPGIGIVLSEGEQAQPAVLAELTHVVHSTVHITCMKWKELNMAALSVKIEQWLTPQLLNLSCNKEPQIVQQIAHIRFPTLKSLSLEYNLIFSIEPLCGLQMPLLEHLNLNDNYINSTRSLRKCNFPYLKKLAISGNRLTEVTSLSQLFSASLRQLIVEKDNTKKVQGHGWTWTMKLEPFAIFETLVLEGDKRLSKRLLKSQTARKYPYMIQ